MSRTIVFSFICTVLAALWFVAGDANAQSSPASAEGQAPIVVAQAERGGLFRSLFGTRKKANRGREIRREQRTKTRVRKTRRTKKNVTAGVSRSSEPPAAVKKDEDAKTVLVVGDFMANALAKGLADAFASNPNIHVVNASNGSSGLVRDDFFNWNTNTPELVAKHEANLILVMVGANDRQAIQSGGKQIAVGDAAWKPAYDAKVSEFAEVLSGQGIPVMWLGLAPVSKTTLSREYSGFNSMFRQKSDLKGFKFVDIWNGFADEKGQYVERGPDINGQNRTLRGESGLNFTAAGRRKLAFFVERDVARFLSDDQAALFAALPGTSGSGRAVPAISAMLPIESISVRPGSELSISPRKAEGGQTTGDKAQPDDPEASADADSEPAVNTERLDEPALSGDTELASNSPGDPVIPNQPLSSPAGRADNYSWPPPQ